MTIQREQLEIEKIRAEISNMLESTIKHGEEIRKLNSESRKFEAEAIKLVMEAKKLGKDLRWYELTLSVAATIAIIAFTKLFL